MNKLTKLLSIFLIAGAVGTGIAGVAGCDKGKGSGSGGGGGGGGEGVQHTDAHNQQLHYDDLRNGKHKITCNVDGCTYEDEEEHKYDDENDATCNFCDYVRDLGGEGPGGEGVQHTDAHNQQLHYDDLHNGKHKITCNVDGCTYEDEEEHKYDDENDATCNFCDYERDLGGEGPGGEVTANKVTFNSNGGSAVADAEADEDGKITEPAAPTKAGVFFGGWYKDTELKDKFDFETDTVEGEITLNAKWYNSAEYYAAIHGGETLKFKADFTEAGNVPYWAMGDGSFPTTQLVGMVTDGSGPLSGYYTNGVAADDTTDPPTAAVEETEYNRVVIEDGALKVLDKSAKTTYAYIFAMDGAPTNQEEMMASVISLKNVSVYAKISPRANNSNWSIFSLISPETEALVSVRTLESGKVGFTVNGVNSTTKVSFEANADLDVLIDVNLASGVVSGYINGIKIEFENTPVLGVDDVYLLGAQIMTAGSASRDVWLKDLEIRVSDADLAEGFVSKLTATYNSYNLENYKVNGETLTQVYNTAKAAIEAEGATEEEITEAFVAGMRGMYAVEDDATVALNAVKAAAIAKINAYKQDPKYTAADSDKKQNVDNIIEYATSENGSINGCDSEEKVAEMLAEIEKQIKREIYEADVHVNYYVEDEYIYSGYEGYADDEAKPAEAPTISGKKFLGWYEKVGGEYAENPYEFPETWAADTELNLYAKYEWYTNEELTALSTNSKWLVGADDKLTEGRDIIKDTDLYTVAWSDSNVVNSTTSKTASATLVGETSATTFTYGLKSDTAVNANSNNRDNALYIIAKESIKLYAYVALSDSGFNGSRKGNIVYFTNPDEEKTIEVSGNATVKTVVIDLYAGQSLTIYIDIPSDGSGSRLWLFGVEAKIGDSFSNATINFHGYEDGTHVTPWNSFKAIAAPEVNPTSETGAFSGWSLTEGAEEADYVFGGKLNAGDVLDLYPVFKAADVTVNFYDEDGSVIEAGIPAVSGGALATGEIPDAPEKDGYNFVGWYTKTDGEYDEDAYDFTANLTAGTLDLYAKYEVKQQNATITCGKDEYTSSNVAVKIDGKNESGATLLTFDTGSEKVRNRVVAQTINETEYYAYQFQTKTKGTDLFTLKAGESKVKVTVYFSGYTDKGAISAATITYKNNKDDEEEAAKTASATNAIESFTMIIEAGKTGVVSADSSNDLANKLGIYLIVIEPV